MQIIYQCQYYLLFLALNGLMCGLWMMHTLIITCKQTRVIICVLRGKRSLDLLKPDPAVRHCRLVPGFVLILGCLVYIVFAHSQLKCTPDDDRDGKPQ